MGFNAQEAVTVITPERLRSIKRLLSGSQLSDGRSAMPPGRNKRARLFMRMALSKRAISNHAPAWAINRVHERRFIVKRLLQQFIGRGRIKRDVQIKNLRQGIAGGFGG
jgi:hypothetical protein